MSVSNQNSQTFKEIGLDMSILAGSSVLWGYRVKQSSNFFLGHLKTLGTQMGYPIGVLIWVVVEINDQTIFRYILFKSEMSAWFTKIIPARTSFLK